MKEKKMARKRKIEEKPEEKQEEKTSYEEILEVTEEFVIEDVSDVASTEDLQNLEDLNVTEVEAAIEDGEKLELVEEKKELKKHNEVIKNSASQGKAPKEIKSKKVRPVSGKEPKNKSGIRSTQGLFFR
jgi:hypothetical protein